MQVIYPTNDQQLAFISGGDIAWTSANSRNFSMHGVQFPHFGLWLPQRNWTIEMWLFSRNYNTSELLYMTGETSVLAYAPASGQLIWNAGYRNNGAQISTGMPADFLNNWHHLQYQLDSQTLRIKVDNITVIEQQVPNTGWYASDAPLNMYPGGENNDVGEMRLWDYVRTEADTAATMNLSLGGSKPGLLGCWRMDDGGMVSGSTLLDRSGNNNHALLL